jgi:hypothetical protein
VNHEALERHLEPDEVAAYTDNALSAEARAEVQAHLAACAECRAEVLEVSRIVETVPAAWRIRRRAWIPAAAAAAAALVLIWPRPAETPVTPVHREEAVTTTIAPRPLLPTGSVDSLSRLVWTSVPYADRYHVRLFDGAGSVIWERETADTVGVIPASVSVRAGVPYFWKVEALTGFDRRAASELVEFIVSERGAR